MAGASEAGAAAEAGAAGDDHPPQLFRAMLHWALMKRGSAFGTFFPLLLSLGSYGAAWISFASGPGRMLEGGQYAQAAAVFATAALLAVPAFLLGPGARGAACVLSVACLAFLANAVGPEPEILAPAAAPVVLALTLGFSAPGGLAAAAAAQAVLIAALRPHSAWGRELAGAGGAQTAALLSILSIVAALGAALRSRENKLAALGSELERMDEAYRKLADANLDFQTFALFLREEGMENERKRIAGEIHDIIGYTLTNLIMLIQAALYGKGGPAETRAILEKARLHADESLSEARRALAALRMRDADRPRGANLFLRLTQNFQDVTGVAVRTDFANLPTALPRPVEKILYRVIQEGLTNAFRHGRATSVDVGFWREGGKLSVRLRDDGSSAAAGPRDEGGRAGIGLAGLRERVEELGGELEAGPVPDGFALRATMPLGEDEDGK
ncbi:MAG: hypothetical protein A2001_02905 [Treponema sp. GWC1_61_84]|nr:MAG: hypothetical protein A2001_02905 [Treponema sp. GWC1_61_84]